MCVISDKDTAKLMENISIAMLNTLNVSFSAVDLMMKKLEEKDYSKLDDYLAMLRHTQYSLLYIAQNLGELGAGAANEAPYTFRAVDVNELCGKLADTVSVLTDTTGITLTFKKCKTDVVLTADYSKLERMLLNLLANSFLHCDKGGKVTLSVDKNDDYVILAVSDNGHGVSNDTMPILFEDFVREIDGYEPKKGVGLGISVAESIARMHGGSIIITSSHEKGTVATVSLPRGGSAVLASDIRSDYDDLKMHNVLTALSSVLDYKKYASAYK